MTSIVNLSLDSIAEEDRQIFEAFTFNPESKQATLKLNGIHKTIPEITVPITFEQYYDETESTTLYKLDNSCIENLQTELHKYQEIGQLDKESILMVLTDDQNKILILDSIKEFHRDRLHQETEPIDSEDSDYGKIISVSQALRTKDGTRHVQGTIIGVSKVFNMISEFSFRCMNCGGLNEVALPYPEFDISNKQSCDKCFEYGPKKVNPEFVSTVIVELQDTDTFDDMDRLSVFLFEKDTEEIRVGESVIIKGDIQIQQNGSKKYFTYLYAQSIHYLNHKDFTLNKLDIEANKRFCLMKGQDNVIDELVSLFDKSIVGYDHVKKGILFCDVNTSELIEKSQHLDALLIGDPGLAKSKLLHRATKLVPGSSAESAQNSSGKSLTAIVEKVNDNTFLRLGAIPRARGAICGLNELARTSMEDQAHLLDVMQEREFTINKHGIRAKIRSPTSIVASANPINRSKWKDDDKIDLNEFPILDPIIDRFDFIFPFKSWTNTDEIDAFVDDLSQVTDLYDNGKLPDYTPFLVKYIQYAKQLNPILTGEARIMIKEFVKKVIGKGFGSPRVLITLHKTVKAIARLKLKKIADEIDAKEAMEFYNVTLLQFQKSVIVSQSPKDIAYSECVTTIKDIKDIGAISLDELIRTVCKRNKQVAIWLGYEDNKPLKMRDNIKIRDVCDRLLNHSNIKRVQEKPTVLQWLCDPCDPCDVDTNHKTKNNEDSDIDNNYNQDNKNNISTSETGSHTSHRSHTTIDPEPEDITEEQGNYWNNRKRWE